MSRGNPEAPCALCRRPGACGDGSERGYGWEDPPLRSDVARAIAGRVPSGACLCPGCRRGDVPSPCTGHCRLDAKRERCTGCARTPEEIGRWHRGDPGERAAILLAVREREPGVNAAPETTSVPRGMLQVG